MQEFQSPSIRTEGMVVFALLLLAAVARGLRGPAVSKRALVLVWGFAALRSARHVPFFAIVAAPVVAAACAAWWRRYSDSAGRRVGRPHLVGAVAGPGPAPAGSARGCPGGRGGAGGDRVGRRRLPGHAVSRAGGGTQRARLAPLPRRCRAILTSDQWADYLIFRLYPRAAGVLRRAQRFLRRRPGRATTASCWRPKSAGGNCWTATVSLWRCCRTIGR